jgi:hypothetical protein
MGLEGDICDCCEGNCPKERENVFERPMYVNRTCDAVDETLVTCSVPKRGRGQGGGRSDSEDESDLENENNGEEEGIFVCRQRFDPLNGASLENETLRWCTVSE